MAIFLQHSPGADAAGTSANAPSGHKLLRTKLIGSAILALSLLPALPASAEKQQRTGKARVRNLPDIEATPSGQKAFDQEFNLDSSAGISNTSFDYGAGAGWNIGISLLNAQFYSGLGTASAFQPDLLFNLEKHWLFGDSQLIAGNQSGAGILPQAAVFMHYAYLDAQQHLDAWDIDIDIGSYYANAALAGQRSVGAHVNLEIPVADSLRLNADYLTGHNSVGAATFKLIYPLPQHWQIAAGVQIPNLPGNGEYIALCGFYWRQ
ncbi:hypothetical protein [Methylomonas koyamae]|uniref:hypothetical protein n=1 Tax=Methylomonas koyamae TaxID=702114 RepID=UPI002873D294|nr:hypothetical protein [Methylomonas koyamae]WNB77389.1 hypothetical protein RI210_07365 [Methylomonas koyamae]